MAKTKFNKYRYGAALDYMVAKFVDSRTHALDEVRNAALTVINQILRKEYPEADMMVFRKYELTRKDYCLRFNDENGAQLFIFSGNMCALFSEMLVDIPSGLSCKYYSITLAERDVIEAYINAVQAEQVTLETKRAEYRSFLYSCPNVEAAHEVIHFPDEVLSKLLGPKVINMIAFNPDILASIQRDFASA